MAIGLIDLQPAIHADVLDAIHNVDAYESLVKHKPIYVPLRREWEPPKYTSMKGWYFLTYGMLILLMTLAGCLLYEVYKFVTML